VQKKTANLLHTRKDLYQTPAEHLYPILREAATIAFCLQQGYVHYTLLEILLRMKLNFHKNIFILNAYEHCQSFERGKYCINFVQCTVAKGIF
jgi:hypothetical protein